MVRKHEGSFRVLERNGICSACCKGIKRQKDLVYRYKAWISGVSYITICESCLEKIVEAYEND